jgi:twitching motility protein PilT
MENNIDELLRQAGSQDATDIHLKVGSAPVARVNGEIRRLDGFQSLTPDDTQSFADTLFTPRAASDFKTYGFADFAYGRADLGRFRVSAFRQRGSVSLVLRKVVRESKTFAELGLPSMVEKFAAEKAGLILVTGPSGSGKTSTMSSIIDWINSNRAVSILTIEDPIEVLHTDKRSVVVQREVGVDTADYAQAIRSAMRHDTDVIVVSEIEDLETARAAIAASETGHLVISSMRTTDPADTVYRVLSLFPETEQGIVRAQLAAQLLGIISQRLLDGQEGNPVLSYEVVNNNERVQEWILGAKETSFLIDIMKESEFFGMQTFDQSMLKLVVSRAIELPTALPHARNVHELRAKAMAAGIAI